MNDYDDSDDCSSANSFRARSNTWPLNRPELAAPNTSICIDETLPEIDLEEDDLFTTNENWSTAFVDHDIMSWDPILNAQSQHQLVSSNQPATIHHQSHIQPQQHQTHVQPHPQQQHSSQLRQQQTQPIHIQHQSPHQQRQHHHHLHHHHHDQQPQQNQHSHHQHSSIQHTHQQQPQHESSLINDGSGHVILSNSANGHEQQHPHQVQAPSHHQVTQHHQTLNSSHCLDPDDPNDYHIQQLHHLRLDNNTYAPNDPQLRHYVPPLCLPNSTTSMNDDRYNVSPNRQHPNHLQHLTSASYDFDRHTDYDSKTLDELHVHQNLSTPHDQQHQHQNHLSDHQQHQLQHLAPSSLDSQSIGSHMLSSSLGTSGIGLSGDLEDLDYKSVDPSTILQNPQHSDQQQTDHKPSQLHDATCGSEIKQSNSNSASRTKLNTPRRNAWGNMSYADLISQAINSTSDKRLTLSQIYDWMVQHVPYFKDKGDSNSSAGWKNSVRHNLSLHSRFKRLQNEGTGKSSWWTINPEANVGKCARRRAASMEASKYEKKRGRAKKRAEAIRQGLVSYPSLTNSSLNGSTSALEQTQAQVNQFHSQQEPQQQAVDQFVSQSGQQSPPTPPSQQQQQQQTTHPAVQQPPQSQILNALDHYDIDHPSQQQQQHLQQLQQADEPDSDNLHDQNLYITTSQKQYEGNDKLQSQQQQQSKYLVHFELYTAL